MSFPPQIIQTKPAKPPTPTPWNSAAPVPANVISAPGPAGATPGRIGLVACTAPTPGRIGLVACTAGLLTVGAGIADPAKLPAETQ